MSKVTKFLSKVKGLGFTALLSGGLAVVLFLFGFNFFSGVALGVFLKANWDIISKWVDDKTGLNV